jgi:hypothetical protein
MTEGGGTPQEEYEEEELHLELLCPRGASELFTELSRHKDRVVPGEDNLISPELNEIATVLG